ncbi:MAG TPA: histidine kinase [Flavihumibacter sp.]
MNKMQTERIRFFGRWQNLLFAFLIGIPLWMVANTFTEQWKVPDDESMATAVVIVFVMAIFSGRYLALIWKDNLVADRITVGVLVAILLLVAFNLFRLLDQTGNKAMGRNLAVLFMSFVVLGLATGILIKILKRSQQQQLTQALVAADKSQAELKLLQAQLSPHFLFNTLNNLYGLSITRPEKLPPLLLKLSDLLRYSVYGASADKVSLQGEIEYLKHYIEFESIRIGDRLDLDCTLEQTRLEKVAIAPMLLIVLVENAFKHSRNTAGDRIQITIKLDWEDDELLFFVSNSCGEQPVNKSLDKSSGFGLENLQQRLDLIYPGQYYLRILEVANRFSADLRIKTTSL